MGSRVANVGINLGGRLLGWRVRCDEAVSEIERMQTVVFWRLRTREKTGDSAVIAELQLAFWPQVSPVTPRPICHVSLPRASTPQRRASHASGQEFGWLGIPSLHSPFGLPDGSLSRMQSHP
ncbi:hypothetical protein M747DRAFT_181242 [Aspergillus niger ATCC 13496]|uniref:Uncharacterized protein n=1 Tax=Aspergillus niger ATCC 13496 TaxID=1353008 RepID=A0A370C427_ASPNG|nr:hypothetical protein M747DRAFT_181242 [Aspergillus niger ATCC 13496]